MSEHLGLVNGVEVYRTSDLADVNFDAVIVVKVPGDPKVPQLVEDVISATLEIDKGLDEDVVVLNCPRVAGKRLVVAPTGAITPYHDVRSLSEAAAKGLERSIKAGSTSPILVLQPSDIFPDSELAQLLAVLAKLYINYDYRILDAVRFKPRCLKLGIYAESKINVINIVTNAIALENARAVARDLGGGDPERMAPPAFTDYVVKTFKQAGVVKVKVIDDEGYIKLNYPLFAAVMRAANNVDRHKARVIFLEYAGTDPSEHVVLVGKGITYDTGGADIKAGGIMVGMSRDKCGAAAVAGFMKACEILKPKHIRATGVLCVARNSVGEECYVSDELILSRNGKIVRVGNTDAEGRMVMADLLCEVRERVENEENVHVYTIATLTGHAFRTVGDTYTIAMDNHVARSKDHARKFRESGERIGDMVEVSTVRREDFLEHAGKNGEDINQCNTKPVNKSSRGHQGPAAFLMLCSGLNEGKTPYTHLDIAASAGNIPYPPTGAPILALVNTHKILKH